MGNGLANLRGGNVVEGSANEGDAGREHGFINGEAGARVDEDAVVAQNLVGLIPLGKTMPVVGTDDEDEVAVGIGRVQRFEGVHHIGRTGEVALEVADT